jgi:hypothetical protein
MNSSGQERDLRFDSFRGLLVLCMSMNHIETPLRLVTDQSLGFVSSAEGFVFMSGFVCGWVYARRRRDAGAAAAREAAWARAGKVYRMHLLTYFATFAWVALIVRLTGEIPSLLPIFFATSPGHAAWLGPMLLYQPGLLDILPMYCGFLLVLPLLLLAVEKRLELAVLGASLLIWLAAQSAAGPYRIWDGRINLGAFNLAAWQLLFVFGAVLGARRTNGREQWHARPALIAAVALAALTLAGIRHGWIATPLSGGSLAALADKTRLGPLRLGNFALLTYLAAAAAAAWPRAFRWPVLAPVGQASLAAFVAQVLMAMVLLTFPHFFLETPAGRGYATVAMLVAVFATAAASRRWRKPGMKPALAASR